MTIRAKIEGAIALAVLVAAVLAFRSWLSEHDLRLRAEEQVKAQTAVQAQAAQQYAALQKQIDQRDQEYKAELQTIDKKFSQAATPEQIANLSGQLMGLKQPIQIVTPPATPSNPNPQQVAIVPTADAPQVKAYELACESCKAQVSELQGNIEDQKGQLASKDTTIKSVSAERDTWEKVAKGGSKWQRVKKAAKWFGWGALAGAVAVCGTGHCK